MIAYTDAGMRDAFTNDDYMSRARREVIRLHTFREGFLKYTFYRFVYGTRFKRELRVRYTLGARDHASHYLAESLPASA